MGASFSVGMGAQLLEASLQRWIEGGRLVVPVGPRETQVLKVVERRGRHTFASELKGACFVPLIGRHGWREGQQ